MSPLAEEWMSKAAADLQTAKREARVRRNPNFDAVCFHAQQAVEKMLKARLASMRRNIPRTHDLTQLLDALLDAEPLWDAWRPLSTSWLPTPLSSAIRAKSQPKTWPLVL